MNAKQLRLLIEASLRRQGFRVHEGQVSLPCESNAKVTIRSAHTLAVQHKRDKTRSQLERHEQRLLKRFASGSEVLPERIQPNLVEVLPNSEEELLFRYASLHWSIPVSSGYGRRLRFLVIDGYNDKVIGLIGLGDPVFSLGAREKWIGWGQTARRERLRYVMDAFVLGSVPPYSSLLCGKLVAMFVASNEVRDAFHRKYHGRQPRIRRTPLNGRLALITTTSALGRSSIYNRLKYHDRLLYQSVGFTQGWGEFHFSNGLYRSITDYAVKHCTPGEKKQRWGDGFRNRREIVRKCLSKIKLSKSWLNHGVQREIFMVPLASNAREFLRGEQVRLRWFDQPAKDLFAFFRERWLLPRSSREQQYKQWESQQWALWTQPDA